MDLSTRDRVKTLGQITGDSKDALIDQLVTSYSAEFERYIGRYVESIARTEVFELQPGEKVVTLNAAPVASISSVKTYYTRDFSQVTALVQYEDYQPNLSGAYLRIEGNLMDRPTYVEVIYTGGMAASQATFTALFPEISDALDVQVLEHLRRVEQGTVSGNVSVQGSSTSHMGPLELTKRAKEVLGLYRRARV